MLSLALAMNDDIVLAFLKTSAFESYYKMQEYQFIIHVCSIALTLKAPIMTAADGIHIYFFIVFQRK